ncbi:hypothetical protein Tco_0725830 [Tanacetum coccineum]|uniref:Uncharacterized protein n=1 Tax=Tanacetum coccineum TaxID=301880 RepID=A0ABQ4YE13_9ASTR
MKSFPSSSYSTVAPFFMSLLTENGPYHLEFSFPENNLKRELKRNYPILEVIQNGNGPVSITTDTQGQIKVLPLRTAEEIIARERERKARTTLLMALPEDHLAKFHKMTDAKEIVFENDVKGSTASSSSSQNVAFVSENTNNTNDVSTAYSVSNTSGQNPQYEQTSSYSLLANQSSCPQLDHEDLDQLDENYLRTRN